MSRKPVKPSGLRRLRATWQLIGRYARKHPDRIVFWVAVNGGALLLARLA